MRLRVVLDPTTIRAEKFWSLVDFTNDGCWTWKAATFGPGGYGSFYVDGRSRMAHIVSYVLAFGVMPPEDRDSDHACLNKACVRWAENHCELVSAGTNVKRAWEQRKMARPKEYSDRVQTQIRLEPELHQAVKAQADAAGLSYNKVVERALTAYLAARAQDPSGDPWDWRKRGQS